MTTATLEQTVKNGFKQGLAIAKSQERGFNLTPINLKDVKTEKDWARLIGEIMYQESKSLKKDGDFESETEPYVLELTHILADDQFKSALFYVLKEEDYISLYEYFVLYHYLLLAEEPDLETFVSSEIIPRDYTFSNLNPRSNKKYEKYGNHRYETERIASNKISCLIKEIKSTPEKFNLNKAVRVFIRLIKKGSASASAVIPRVVDLVKVTPPEKFDLKAIVGIFEECMISGGFRARTAAMELGNFVKSIPPEKFDLGIILSAFFIPTRSSPYKHIIWDFTHLSTNHLGEFAKLIPTGKVKPWEVQKLYEVALSNNLIDSLAYALPDFSRIYPEKAFEIYKAAYERIFENNDLIWRGERDPVSYTSLVKVRLETAVLFCSSAKKAVLENQNSTKPLTKPNLLNLILSACTNLNRLSLASQIYDGVERKIHNSTDEEKISAFVEREHNNSLKPFERDQLTAIMNIYIKDIHKYAREHAGTLLLGGWTAHRIIDLTDDIVKIASSEQNKREEQVYSLKGSSSHFMTNEEELAEVLKDPLGYFGLFMARQKGRVIEFNDGLSMLIIENLQKKQPRHKIAAVLYTSLTGERQAPWQTRYRGHNTALLNMFLLGLAHKGLTQAAKNELKKKDDDESRIIFSDVDYAPLEGGLHVDAIKRPLPETSDYVDRTQMRNVPDELIRESKRRIQDFRRYVKGRSSKSIILADNKIIENTLNGYMHDFAMVGWGLEIEDITFGLVEPRLGIPLKNIKYYVEAYIRMRCLHDDKFVGDVLHGKDQEMISGTDDAALHALSIYASCTRKRIQQMETGRIIPRRNYFINAMQYMLDKGHFLCSTA